MKMKLIKIFFLMLISSNLSAAALQDALDDMYNTLVIPPASIDTERAGVISGGTIRLRSKARRFNVVGFQSPYIRSGCGGIDMYGGSFSFINLDEFRALLRQIGSQALGYAFQLALNNLCPQCSSVMSGLEKKVAAMNKHLQDTCALAKGIVQKAVSDKVTDDWVEAGKAFSALTDTTDWFEANKNAQDDPARISNKEDAGCTSTDTRQSDLGCENDESGNATWKKLASVDMSGSIVGVADVDIKNLLTNIVGFHVNSAVTEGVGSRGVTGITYAPTITNIYQILSPEKNDLGEGIEVWECDPADPNRCIDPVKVNWSWQGAKEYSKTALFGNDVGGGVRDMTVSSSLNNTPAIISYLVTGVAGTISPEANTFLGATSGYILPFTLDIQSKEGEIKLILEQSSDVIAEQVTLSLAEGLHSAYKDMDQRRQKGVIAGWTKEQRANWKSFWKTYEVAKENYNKNSIEFISRQLELKLLRDTGKVELMTSSSGE